MACPEGWCGFSVQLRQQGKYVCSTCGRIFPAGWPNTPLPGTYPHHLIRDTPDSPKARCTRCGRMSKYIVTATSGTSVGMCSRCARRAAKMSRSVMVNPPLPEVTPDDQSYHG